MRLCFGEVAGVGDDEPRCSRVARVPLGTRGGGARACADRGILRESTTADCVALIIVLSILFPRDPSVAALRRLRTVKTCSMPRVHSQPRITRILPSLRSSACPGRLAAEGRRLVGTARHRHLPARPSPTAIRRSSRSPRLPGLERQGLPAAVPRPHRAGRSAPHRWQAVHLENEWLRLMVLPELGGRIHVGYDKTTGYDFFYRNNVIKPALVGLAGPWISGGVEFNWPQHHRPATFLPIDVADRARRRRLRDGLVQRPRPVHPDEGHARHPAAPRPSSSSRPGAAAQPHRAARRRSSGGPTSRPRCTTTTSRSSPRTCTYVADHARRAVTAFPRADRPLLRGRLPGPGRDPADPGRGPARLVPQHPGADLVHGRPTPTTTSSAATTTPQARASCTGPTAIAPGKKQWTWGNAPFGQAWDAQPHRRRRPVRRADGRRLHRQPAGLHFLAPGETKIFSQYWYPIQEIGPAHQATLTPRCSLDVAPRQPAPAAVGSASRRPRPSPTP